jgi:hypothetical protein
MSSKKLFLVFMLLLIGAASQAFAQATIAVAPTNVPKGAYVNGPLGEADDNFFWQVVTITLTQAHAAGQNMILTLPSGMSVAKVVSANTFASHVSVSHNSAASTLVVDAATAAASIRINFTVGAAAPAEVIRLMFPVSSMVTPPANTDDYYVTFSDGAADNVANDSGTFVTFATPAPNAVGTVTFTSFLSGNNDSTAWDGEVYPDIATAAHSALPDYVLDQNTVIESASLGTLGQALFDLTDATDNNDMRFRYYAAQDSTLAHITRNMTGVITLENYAPAAVAPFNTENYAVEAFTGNQGFTVSSLPEGNWYIYVVSTVTGDFPLGRSGKLTVFHYPQVDILAWDYQADGVLGDGAPNPSDNVNMTIDSGLFVGINGVILPSVTPTDNVDLYLAVDDHDDSATVSLFYSSASDLKLADVITSGTAPNLVVTGLRGATQIIGNLKENSEDEDGFIVYNWNVTPSGLIYVPASEYTIYAVANDGKHQHVFPAKGFNESNPPTYSGSTQLTMSVKHSPDLVIDSLDEYNLGTDTASNADVTIDQSKTDVVMISWGKTGINGDRDIDDSCTIEFYVDYDTDANPDYGSDDFAAIRTAASSAAGNTATGTHKIHVTTIAEDPDGKADSYYAWNLKEDWVRSGWAPVTEAGAAGTYRLYAIISEGDGASDTKRVVCLGINGVFDNAAVPPSPATIIEFTNVQPYLHLYDPPISGLQVTADQTFRLNLDAFDIDGATNVGIFLANANAREILTNGDFEEGTGSWTVGANWAITNGAAVHTTGAVATLVSASGQTDGASAYLLTIVLSNTTAGTVTVTSTGLAAGNVFSTNGTHTVAFTSTGASNITITPTGTFNGQIESVSLQITSGAYTVGAMTTTMAALGAYKAGSVYALTSDTGSRVAHATYPWLIDNNLIASPFYDVQLRIPGGGVRYSADVNAAAVNLADGTYYVYIGADDEAVPDNFGDGTEVLYRSPGTLTITGLGTASSQRNLMMEPRRVVSTVGDTTTVQISMADEGNPMDLIELYIAVDKSLFTVVNSSTSPFIDPAGFGTMLANEAINDAANNRWVLHTVLFNSGDVINTTNTGFGSQIASFKVICKGTSSDTGETTAITFMNEPAKNWVTKIQNDGQVLGASNNVANMTVDVKPRGSVYGTVQFQGRSSASQVVNFILRERGSYVATTDSVFLASNDGFVMATQTIGLSDSIKSASGVQFKLNADGDFKLSNVPTGEWELFMQYNRYLAKSVAIDINPGLDSIFVNWTGAAMLIGGDSYGYTDTVNDAYPNNVINQDDVNRIAEAFLSTPDSSRWATAVNTTTGGKYNYKWADINEDNKVDTMDLTMATDNFIEGGSAALGAQPVYQKVAVETPATNLDAVVEIVNAPTQIIAGQTYQVQVVIRGAADVRAYHVDLGFNAADLTVNGVVKGGFITEMSYTFPIFSDTSAGLVNSVYGPYSYKGDGVLAEVYFTANRTGAFSADMLPILKAQLVNSEIMSVDLAPDAPTGVEVVDAPAEFVLSQNFPNPFNPTTMINFTIPASGNVDVKVYDILGRQVRTLVSGVYQPGNYSVMWDARDESGNMVSNGVYFYTIRAKNFSSTRKMMFMK